MLLLFFVQLIGDSIAPKYSHYFFIARVCRWGNHCNLMELDWIWKMESKSIEGKMKRVRKCGYVCFMCTRPPIHLLQAQNSSQQTFVFIRSNGITSAYLQNITEQLDIKRFYMCVLAAKAWKKDDTEHERTIHYNSFICWTSIWFSHAKWSANTIMMMH